MTELLTIAEVDPSALHDEQWRALHRLRVVIDLEELPGDEPIVFEEMQREMVIGRPGSRTRYWMASAGDRAVGFAWVNVDLKDNLHLAWSFVCVDPERRRQGIGSTLLGRVVEAAEEEGRTSLGIDFRHGTDGALFAPGFGFEEKAIEHHNRTYVASVDAGMIQEWIDRARERAAAYELRSWVSPTPEPLLDEYARVFNVMNTAPRDDLDMGDFEMTVDLMVDREATLAPRGVEKWVMAAVAPDGTFAGFTEMFFSQWRSDVAYQGNTGVDPAHRDRGLGRWLKAAMFQRLRAERPLVEKVDTWNAGSNEPMLAINHAMGFAPVNVWGNAQAEVSTVRGRLRRSP